MIRYKLYQFFRKKDTIFNALFNFSVTKLIMTIF